MIVALHLLSKHLLLQHFIKKAAGIEKGSSVPNTNKVGKVTRKQLEEIAAIKCLI